MALVLGVDFLDILAVLRGNTYRGWDPEATRSHRAITGWPR